MSNMPMKTCLKHNLMYALVCNDCALEVYNNTFIPLPTKTEGTKLDSGKPRLDLLCPVAIEELSKVLSFGATKYAPYNWAKGISYSRILAAMLRHIFAYMRGESTDLETGLSHIAHAMCGCMFILHFEKYKSEFDDRPKDIYVDKTPKQE